MKTGGAQPRSYIHRVEMIIKTKNHKHMITTNVERFIELQTAINNQIDQYGQADEQLADELDQLGDQLTDAEISALSNLMYEDTVSDGEYEEYECWVD